MSAPDAADPAAPSARIRPFYWSVRRELWENRSLYVVPLAVAALVLLGFLLGEVHVAHVRFDALAESTMRRLPYEIAAISVLLASLAAGAFYCLGALHGERRDRSILFWKSLPVSDPTAVLAKAFMPMAVQPAIAFAVILAVQLLMFLIETAALLAHGLSVAPLWARDPVFSDFWTLSYGLATVSLWYAPVYGWLLLVSAWARRAPILWALAPVVGVPLVERLAFGTSYVADLLKGRLHGGFSQAFSPSADPGMPVDLARPELLRFLQTPQLWLGLAAAAAFLAGAVWLRRRGEPL